MSLLRPLTQLGLLALSSLPSLAGLKEGEIFANTAFRFGSTLLATDPALSLTAVDPDGTASLTGRMSSFNLSGSATINNTRGTAAAFATGQVAFADSISLTAPGVPTGQLVTVRLAWNIGSTISSSASSSIRTLSEVLVQGPAQSWRRQTNNYGDPVTNNPNGRVEFDFVVKEGTPEVDNIRLNAAFQSVTGIPVSIYSPPYSGNPSASLTVTFLQVVSVKKQNGQALPIWNIISTSLFPYGVGNGTPVPSNPTLLVNPSPLSPNHLRFTWQTSSIETYNLVSSTNDTTWTHETTVVGNDLPAVVDRLRNGQRRLYRLEYVITGGAVGP